MINLLPAAEQRSQSSTALINSHESIECDYTPHQAPETHSNNSAQLIHSTSKYMQT